MIVNEQSFDPALLIEDDDFKAHVKRWLNSLSGRHREIIIRRFGLFGHDSATLEEVGKAVGLTRERVRQLQIDTLKKLREMLASEEED